MNEKKVFPTESGRSLWAANSTPAVRLDYVSACIIINIFVGQANFICSHKSQWTLDLEISWESGVSLTRYADSVLINGSTWYLTNQHSNQGTGKFRKGLECRVGEEREGGTVKEVFWFSAQITWVLRIRSGRWNVDYTVFILFLTGRSWPYAERYYQLVKLGR